MRTLLLVLCFTAAAAIPKHAALALSEYEAHLKGEWVLPELKVQQAYLLPVERNFTRKLARDIGKGTVLHKSTAFAGCSRDDYDGSVWAWRHRGDKWPDGSGSAALLRLLLALKGRTVCMVGDSVMQQFMLHLIYLVRRCRHTRLVYRYYFIPEFGGAHKHTVRELNISRGSMDFKLIFTRHERRIPPKTESVPNDVRARQRLPPGDWMDTCDVMVLNAGLHYNPKESPLNTPPPLQHYPEAMGGLLSWALNWSSLSPHRVVVWRDSTPQHFEGGGVWQDGFRNCTPFVNDTAMPKQPYNMVMDGVLRNMSCGVPRRCKTPGLEWLASNPSQANRSALEWTSPTGPGKRLVGPLWRWPVWDLFVGHHEWHMEGHDCTHFCFMPTLWEALYDRFTLLMGVIDNTRSQWEACRGPKAGLKLRKRRH
eukprot:Hpha_TRINITY_DN18677_c0_g1::TRINITY_DN18677_c0_g1_i1::g.115630::m.115630